MKRNFRSPKDTFPFSGILGNTSGQLAQKLPKTLLRYNKVNRSVLAIVTLSGIYAQLASVLYRSSAIFQNIVGDNAELCPNPIMEHPVAFTFAAATVGDFINSKFRTL